MGCARIGRDGIGTPGGTPLGSQHVAQGRGCAGLAPGRLPCVGCWVDAGARMHACVPGPPAKSRMRGHTVNSAAAGTSKAAVACTRAHRHVPGVATAAHHTAPPRGRPPWRCRRCPAAWRAALGRRSRAGSAGEAQRARSGGAQRAPAAGANAVHTASRSSCPSPRVGQAKDLVRHRRATPLDRAAGVGEGTNEALRLSACPHMLR